MPNEKSISLLINKLFELTDEVGKAGLCTPHELYLALASTAGERLLCYQVLLKEELRMEQISNIRTSLNKGIVLGNSNFSNQIAALTGKGLTTGKQGRLLGWRKKVGGES